MRLRCHVQHWFQHWYKTPLRSELFLKHTFGLPFLDYIPWSVRKFFIRYNAGSAIWWEGGSLFELSIADVYMTSSLLFPPTLWASSDFSIKRTTNGCEAFHKQLNSMFYHAHPSIFELLERIQDIMLMNTFKINDSNNARPAKAQETEIEMDVGCEKRLRWKQNR